MVLLDLVTEKTVHVGQWYVSHETVLSESRQSNVPGGIVLSLKDYYKLRNIIQNVSVGGTTFQ